MYLEFGGQRRSKKTNTRATMCGSVFVPGKQCVTTRFGEWMFLPFAIASGEYSGGVFVSMLRAS